MIDLDELDAIFSRCEVGSGLDLEDEDTRMGDVDDESYSSSYCGKSLFKYHNLLGFETKTIVELPWLKLTILVFCPKNYRRPIVRWLLSGNRSGCNGGRH